MALRDKPPYKPFRKIVPKKIMIDIETVLPYLKVPCPGCTIGDIVTFTEYLNDRQWGDLPFQCPRCYWVFDLKEHSFFWFDAKHKRFLNGDKPQHPQKSVDDIKRSIKEMDYHAVITKLFFSSQQ